MSCKVVSCLCGLDLRSEQEGLLISAVQDHALHAHKLELDADQVKAMMYIEQTSEKQISTSFK